MKIRIASDLHMDSYPHAQRKEVAKELTSGEFDIVVIAGDICNGPAFNIEGNLILILQCTNKPVIYVPGNHDYAGLGNPKTIGVLFDRVKDMYANFYPLDNAGIPCSNNNNVITLNGQRFIGTTLWYTNKPREMGDSQWFDFRHIRRFGEWSHEKALECAEFLSSNVVASDVVITHMLPHRYSIAPQYANSHDNKFFLHDMSEVIANNQPKLWIHGHTHTSCDYVVDNTRVVCNPHGYGYAGLLNEPNPEYGCLTVEV